MRPVVVFPLSAFSSPARRLAAGFLVAAFSSATPASAAADASAGQVRGVSIVGSVPTRETTAEIMARHERLSSQPPQEPLHFFIGRQDSSRKEIDPAGTGLIQGPATGPMIPTVLGPGGPLAPQPIGVNASGPGSGPTPCGTPPDTMGAVGPTQFIAFVNCNIVSYNKATGAPDGVLNTTPGVFFTSVKSSSVSDPHIRYDRLTQRWFLVIIDVTFPNNRVLLAVSNSATITPSTVWSFFFFQSANGTHTNCLADYPTPGIDANALYIGVNQFCGSTLGTASYAGSDGYVVQKSSVLGAGPIHLTAFQSMSDAFTPQGVDNADPSATEGWFLSGSQGFWNRLNLARVSNPGTLSPTITTTSITTANQGSPATQPHSGNTGGTIGNIDGSDNRPLAATYRDGSLWTAMGVGTTVSASVCQGTASTSGATRDAVYWWELQGIPTGSTPSIKQAGIVCDTGATNPSFYSFGTIMPNGQGHAALGFSIAGAATFIGAGTAGRLAGDPLNTLQAINVYAPGVAAYNPTWDNGSTNGFRRWGDYSYTTLDPCNDMTLWTIQEYVGTADQYSTRFAELKAPPPATPVSVNPPSVAPGQTSVSVVVTGTSSAGSGFYDTPASMASEPCRTRLAGAISGGVTVNSVTYNSPTHVTLSLNTTAATTGAKNVMLTNPDGQNATGTGILTICSPPPTPTALNGGPYCPGATVALSTPTVPGATYAWSGPDGFTSALQNPTIPGASAAKAGTYSVTITVAGCTSAAGQTTVVVSAAPATPVITAPSNVGAGSPGRTASVPAHAGSTYAWTIGNGTITSATNTPQITFTAGTAGTPLSLAVTETNSSGCTSAAGNAAVTVAPRGSAVLYYSAPPCRQLDTRSTTAMTPGSTLTVPLIGAPCGIPSAATAVSVNVTVTEPTAPGYLTLYPADGTQPLVSNTNFVAGQTRANNALLRLATDGSGAVKVYNGSAGTVQVIIDVSGHFE